MKKLLAILTLVSALAVSSRAIAATVTLEWDYPPLEVPGTTFTVYTVSALPITGPVDWKKLGSVVGETRITVTIPTAGQQYFVATASNLWGESGFSNVVATPALPRDDVNLRILRAIP